MSSPSARRSSIGMLLRRSKSSDLRKQQAAAKDRELQRQRDASTVKSPPRLPILYNGVPGPQLQIGGEVQSDSLASVASQANQYNSPSPPRPSMEPARSVVSVPPPPAWDPYSRAESMTNRGRYSYASSAISTVNSPRRVRRRKDPTPFNVLIVGSQSSGKSSFLEFLKSALALPLKKRTKNSVGGGEPALRASPSGSFVPHYIETEVDHERIGLTLWDSEGLEKNVVDLQLREMSAFLESKFEDTFTEEMKVVRSPGAHDTHIHAVFLILDPARLDRNIAAAKTATANGLENVGKRHAHARIMGSLDEDLDLQVLRTLQGKTSVIPVISKADTVTVAHMKALKKSVWDSLKRANLNPLEALGFDNDEDSSIAAGTIDEEKDDDGEHTDADTADGPCLPIQGSELSPQSKRLSFGSIRRQKVSEENKEDEVPYLPMSIISPDIYEPSVVGRQFPWGFADPYKEEHCDFVRLKETVFGEWRGELREASKEQWYEGWRTSRLNRRESGKGSRR